jgi:hypothetical protein
LSDGYLTESAFAEMVRKTGVSCNESLPAHQTFICTTDVEAYQGTQVGEFDYLRRPWWTVKKGDPVVRPLLNLVVRNSHATS